MTGRVRKVGNSRPLMATVGLSTGELNDYKRNLQFNPSRKSENWYRPGGRREKRKLYERRDRRKRIDIGSKGDLDEVKVCLAGQFARGCAMPLSALPAEPLAAAMRQSARVNKRTPNNTAITYCP